MSSKDKMTQLATMWKECPEEEKTETNEVGVFMRAVHSGIRAPEPAYADS